MSFDSATVMARTAAGDAELARPTNGLALGQRRLLTQLEQPRAFDKLVTEFSLDPEKTSRDLAKLASHGLIVVQSPNPAMAIPVTEPSAGASAPEVVQAAGPATTSRVPLPSPLPEPDASMPAAAGVVIGGLGGIGARRHPWALMAGAAAVIVVAGGWLALRGSSSAAKPEIASGAAAVASVTSVPATPVAVATVGTASEAAATMVPDPAAGLRARAQDTKAAPAVLPRPETRAVPSVPAPSADIAPRRAEAASQATPASLAPPGPAKSEPAAPTLVATPPAPAPAPATVATVAAPPIVLASAAPSAAEAATSTSARSTLVPLTRESPDFPRDALSAGVTRGTVKARVTVDAAGKVTGVEIVDAQPRRLFDRSVTRALGRWTFEPGAAGRTTEVEVAFNRE